MAVRRDVMGEVIRSAVMAAEWQRRRRRVADRERRFTIPLRMEGRNEEGESMLLTADGMRAGKANSIRQTTTNRKPSYSFFYFESVSEYT